MKKKKWSLQDYRNWFGNRGVMWCEGSFKSIWSDDKYIYWIPAKDHDGCCFWGTTLPWVNDDTVQRCLISNAWAEVEDEIPIKELEWKQNG